MSQVPPTTAQPPGPDHTLKMDVSVSNAPSAAETEPSAASTTSSVASSDSTSAAVSTDAARAEDAEAEAEAEAEVEAEAEAALHPTTNNSDTTGAAANHDDAMPSLLPLTLQPHGATTANTTNDMPNIVHSGHERRPSTEFFFSLTRAFPRHRRNQSLGAAAAAPSADDMLQTAIELHERMELEASTEYFRKAADLGSVVGMYMYGIALRSGWGCKPDGATAFTYLARAADLAMRRATAAATAAGDATSPQHPHQTTTAEQRAELAAEKDLTRRELAVAMYELGQSLRNGWGVKRSRRKGAVYLQMAADMGDTDAQVDIASCFMSGDGVSRDKMQAARYFRLASVAGNDLPSNSWIWKEKYDVCGVTRASPHLQPVLPVALPTPLV